MNNENNILFIDEKKLHFFQWCIHENSRLYLLELTCSLSAYFKTLEEVYAEWRRMQNRYLSTFVVSCPQPGRCCKLGALRPIFWNINIFTITWNFFITPKWDDLKGICFVTKTVETGHSITVYNYNAQKFWWGGQKQNWYYPFAFFFALYESLWHTFSFNNFIRRKSGWWKFKNHIIVEL